LLKPRDSHADFGKEDDRTVPEILWGEPALAVGERVGRYRVVDCIGAGGMGEVFLAVDDSLGRQAAIKVLGRQHLGDTVFRHRFVSEARALARLSHVNLITVYEAGTVGEEERPYFAMELLAGGDAGQLVTTLGPQASPVVAAIAVGAAAGLGEAARAGITHRDVKPANLGITAQGVVKVTDFGVAKSQGSGQKLTNEGLTVGTADYIAPEQARGEPVDERADVYALGCTLFHLLTGRPPYNSDGRSALMDIVAAHLVAPIPDPRGLAADVDPDLAELIAWCMEKSRDRRPTFATLLPMLIKIHRRLRGEVPRFAGHPMGPVVGSY
jgi:serine/threonine-protein kinase